MVDEKTKEPGFKTKEPGFKIEYCIKNVIGRELKFQNTNW